MIEGVEKKQKNISKEMNGGFLCLALIVTIIGMCIMYFGGSKEEYVTFTSKDIEAIEKAMDTYGEDITVSITKDGELTINLGEDSR